VGKRMSGALATSVAAFLLSSLPLSGAHASTACWSLRPAERKLQQATELSRRNHGLSRLPLDQDLSKVARHHSAKMAARGVPFHTGDEGFPALLTGAWRLVHENVGMATITGTGDMARLEQEFMHSPTHRQNILRPGNDYLGVGIVRKDGSYFVTVLFVEGQNPGTTLRMATCS
jgi:uncharacterized protein YkwD